MPAPVISNTSSVLCYLQGQTFGFQAAATNSPTNWQAQQLPPGLTINASTGLISGAVTLPGVFIVIITASNADGSSSAEFCIAIEAGAMSDSFDIDLDWDLVSSAVQLAGVQPLSASSTQLATGAEAGPDKLPAPLFMATYGADIALRIRTRKNGKTIILEPSALALRLFKTAAEEVAVTSVFTTTGTGDATRYRLAARLDADDVKTAVNENEGEFQKRAPLYGKLEITFSNTTGLGSAPLKFVSDAFGVEVAG